MKKDTSIAVHPKCTKSPDTSKPPYGKNKACRTKALINLQTP